MSTGALLGPLHLGGTSLNAALQRSRTGDSLAMRERPERRTCTSTCLYRYVQAKTPAPPPAFSMGTCACLPGRQVLAEQKVQHALCRRACGDGAETSGFALSCLVSAYLNIR